MRILGIDPGLNATGYGVLDATRDGFVLKEAGAVMTRAADGLPRRLAAIHRHVGEIIDKYAPQAIVLEKLYAHYRHPLTATLLGHARGVVCMLAEQKKVSFFEYAATHVKRVTTGSGHASKKQIQKMVEHILSSKQEFSRADITDALALAMTHAYALRSKI